MAFGGGGGPDPDRTGGEEMWRSAHHALADVLCFPDRSDRAARERGRGRSAFPELDCVRDRLPLRDIMAAERRSIAIGVSAERVLITAGLIDEDSYVRALAHWLGLEFETLQHRDRASCPIEDDRLLEAASTGLLPLLAEGELVHVVAPRSARQLIDGMMLYPRMRMRLTSSQRLSRFIIAHWNEPIGRKATATLSDAWPHLSAMLPNWPLRILLMTIVSLVLAASMVFPSEVLEIFEVLLSVGFLAWLGLRLFGSFLQAPPRRHIAITDRDLPIYTVIAALYREANAVEHLVAALRNLDYPAEKLDIKFIVEADDHETPAALTALCAASSYEIIVAPEFGPRTKPKALNVGLVLARGSFTVIYDAEDRPERQQLRRAFEAFKTTDAKVACVQASLTIDNTDDGWLARLFTAEYAAQFDLFLPGLAALKLPLPLGGSSNHFRTSVLRELGAWDPYNVTEDADLGMRLARFGYRATVVSSTTYEEAPARLGSWLSQRTRWFKGWMRLPAHPAFLRSISSLGQ
jgi:hypothetical protein